MNGDSHQFIEAINSNNIALLEQIPKSDLHSHAPLASRFSVFCNEMNARIKPPPEFMDDINDMNNYIITNLRNLIVSKKGFNTVLKLAFQQAKNDNVVKLEMSIDAMFLGLFSYNTNLFVKKIEEIYNSTANNINYNPEIGISRNIDIKEAERLIIPCIESGYFKSIDLYGDELYRDAKEYKFIYKTAKNYGLKLKCHAGEFGDASSVRYTVETLELDEVQHGISSSDSIEVMKWLRNNNIQLNICPTSNIKLKRVRDIRVYPARKLFDSGIKITINTDDIMIFDQSVSQEFLNLYKSGLFSADELNIIRVNGLN